MTRKRASPRSFSANYGGTEANVLACLHAFGHETKYLTALPEGPLGEAVLDHLHRFGIDTSDIVVQGDTLGLYFSENGNESRGTNVIYYRRHSEFTRLSEASFDYDKVFCGVSIFHISGISLALSDSSRALAFRLIREAKARSMQRSARAVWRGLPLTHGAKSRARPGSGCCRLTIRSRRWTISCFPRIRQCSCGTVMRGMSQTLRGR